MIRKLALLLLTDTLIVLTVNGFFVRSRFVLAFRTTQRIQSLHEEPTGCRRFIMCQRFLIKDTRSYDPDHFISRSIIRSFTLAGPDLDLVRSKPCET